ncbi:MAG: carbon-nitrogen hydrolase family protein [Deltaproteobacteria bacterium]|nr:carbon-nitrogen hydrolase family protein [Deltaproteobacteria bacterium]
MATQFEKYVAAVVQASPIFLNRRATTEKACKLIREARKQGARLVVFPEAWIPTFPHWPRALPKGERELSQEAWVQLYQESVEIPGPETDALSEAAREAGCHVVIGVNEKSSEPGATLYNTLVFVGDQGQLLGKRRKLLPTYEERCCWGIGGTSDLPVFQTPLGTLGGLICGEHNHPLLRHALAVKGEQVHIAVWPKGSHLDRTADILSRSHAIESQAYVVMASGLLSPDQVPDDFPLKKRTLWNVNGGSGIIGPDGDYLAGPVYDKETILYAEIDPKKILEEKWKIDTVGHYSRPDVVRLVLNEGKQNH